MAFITGATIAQWHLFSLYYNNIPYATQRYQ